MSERPTIFLSAAEASGDDHAAHLIEALRERLGEARFVGAGGPRMAEAGCEILEDLTARASMLGGPFLRLGYYMRMLRRLKRQIREIRPDVHVPVDSPALNWHLAAAARGVGTPVVYFIAPQVWAWAPWRSAKLARLTDAVACILPFEQEYLRGRGVNAHFVGHPICDRLTADDLQAERPDLSAAWLEGTWRVALLPGSRSGEILRHTPALIEASRAIRERWPRARCLLAARGEEPAGLLRDILCKAREKDIEIRTGMDSATRLLAESHFAVVGSGTITLEAAMAGVPMVIFYHVGGMMRLLHRTLGRSRRIVPTRRFTLVNILAGREIVPELVPWHGNSRRLSEAVLEMMRDLGGLHQARRDLLAVAGSLHRAVEGGSAAGGAAELICRYLRK